MENIQNTVENLRCPTYPNQEYIWFAEYNDSSKIYEIENDGKENPFDYIDKNNIKNFGLIGNGIKFEYNLETGIFDISNKKFFILIENKDKIIDIEKQKKDIITFKMAHTDGMIVGRKVTRYKRFIDGYFVGYKTNIDDIYIQILFGIPVTGEDRRPFFGVKISDKTNSEYIVSLKQENNLIDQKELSVKNNKAAATNLYFF